MATSSECDLTTSTAATSKSASSHITSDRRKRAFKNLVSSLAERLEKRELNDICWQMDLPDSLMEKPALETLKWLVRKGKCSETDVQPLVQLLKDICREDLAERVETFQKEFGAEIQGTHGTMFESVPNCTVAEQDDTPSGIAITKAQQETSIAFQEDSYSENGSACSLASNTSNLFLPSFTPLKPSGSYHRVSENSIQFTLESSSASSSLLEMPIPPPPVGQHPPSGLMWHFPSNSSSSISQENMLFHSSNSDIMEPNVMTLPQYQPISRAQTMIHQRDIPWYCQNSQTVASLFAPMPVADQNHGSSSSMSVLHQRHPYVRSSTGGLPMCRSLSQDYHKPQLKNRYSTLHRSHTFTPADRQERGTHCSAVQAPMDNSRVPEVSKELPQNQMCCAHLPTCRNYYKPHTHCGQSDYSVHPDSPSAQHLRCPCHYQSSVPIGHRLSISCNQRMLRRGWDSGEESVANSEHEQLLQKNNHMVVDECECLNHNSGACDCIHKMCQYDDIQSSDAESELSMATVSRNEDHNDNDCHLKGRNASYAKKRYSVPVFQSQCLDIRKDIHSAESAQSNRQSLDVSALKRGSTCMSTSSGNASTSNRSLTSVNTLIGSATNSKSPVSSPPMIRNKGDAGTSAARVQAAHSVATVSQTSVSKWRPVSALFHTKPKPRLIEPNKIVWPVKRDKLNKYIYKHKIKLLKCKLNWELTSSEHEIGPSPKLSLQLHPYGAEEDSNKFITAKVSIESRRCCLHSDTRIRFTISAREGDPTSGARIGKLQEKHEQITKSFFYIKQFIDHQDIKNSSCDYIQVIASATLIMPSH